MIDHTNFFCYQFIVSAAFTFTFTYMPMTGKMTSSQQTANNYFYWLPSCCLPAWQRGVTTYNSFHQDTYKDNNDTCPMPTPSHTTTYDFFYYHSCEKVFFYSQCPKPTSPWDSVVWSQPCSTLAVRSHRSVPMVHSFQMSIICARSLKQQHRWRYTQLAEAILHISWRHWTAR